MTDLVYPNARPGPSYAPYKTDNPIFAGLTASQ